MKYRLTAVAVIAIIKARTSGSGLSITALRRCTSAAEFRRDPSSVPAS
jgi:hypothetical protein